MNNLTYDEKMGNQIPGYRRLVTLIEKREWNYGTGMTRNRVPFREIIHYMQLDGREAFYIAFAQSDNVTKVEFDPPRIWGAQAMAGAMWLDSKEPWSHSRFIPGKLVTKLEYTDDGLEGPANTSTRNRTIQQVNSSIVSQIDNEFWFDTGNRYSQEVIDTIQDAIQDSTPEP